MKIHDSLIGALLFALGLWVLITAWAYPQMQGQSIGPGTFPSVLGALFMAGGVLLAVSGLRTQGMKLIHIDPGWRHPNRLAAALIATAGVVLFSLGFETIGFPVAGFVLLTALFFLSGYRGLTWVLVSATFVLAVHLLMTRLLYVPLPAGILKGIL